MDYTQILELACAFPLRTAHPGEIIIQEEGESPELLIIEAGTVEVRRGGQLVAVIDQPGATLGEVSMLLNSPSTADVVARGEVKLRVIADPAALFSDHPALALVIARELAERLARVTSYLARLKDEMAESGDHTELVPQIVSELLAWRRLAPDTHGPAGGVDEPEAGVAAG
ncbi:MAG: cyclic nucleotide-binding domain-containing protein [Acidimicrobiales bacterium]